MDEEDGMDTRQDDDRRMFEEIQTLLKEDSENYWYWLQGLDYPLNEDDDYG